MGDESWVMSSAMGEGHARSGMAGREKVEWDGDGPGLDRVLPWRVGSPGASGVFIIHRRLRKRGYTTGVAIFRG